MELLTATFLTVTILRMLQIYRNTSVMDYLLLSIAYVFLLLNALTRAFFGFGSIQESLVGIFVLNILAVLFFRIAHFTLYLRHRIFLVVINAVYGTAIVAEVMTQDSTVTLLRQFVFSCFLVVISISAWGSIANTQYVSVHRSQPIALNMWRLFILFFILLGSFRILAIISTITGIQNDLIMVIAGHLPHLIFAFSVFNLYLSFKRPEFLLFSHQQIFRALQTAKVIQKLNLVEENKSKRPDPNEILSYLKDVSEKINHEP